MRTIALLFFLSVSAFAETYVVQKGDNLNKIADKFGTTVEELQKINGIKNANLLRIGQKLETKAPAPKKASGKVPAGKQHTVVKGDTYYKIAKDYGMTINDLKAANPSVNPSKLAVGQKLNLAVAKAPKAPKQEKPTTVAKQEKKEPKPAAQPAPKPAPVSKPVPTPKPAPQPMKFTKVVVTQPVSLGDFAKHHGMTVAEVNEVNNWKYSADTVFDTGSVAFVIQR